MGTERADTRNKISMRLLTISRSIDYLIKHDFITTADLDLELREAQDIVEGVRDRLPRTITV
jgi:hypothetical protein